MQLCGSVRLLLPAEGVSPPPRELRRRSARHDSVHAQFDHVLDARTDKLPKVGLDVLARCRILLGSATDSLTAPTIPALTA